MVLLPLGAQLAEIMFRRIGRILNWLGIAAIVAPVLGGAVYSAVDYVRYSGLLGEVWVVDGDTLDIGRQRYRLYGIDAPGSEEACTDFAGRSFNCGSDAKAALAALVDGQKLSCEERDRERDKTIIAICYAGGYDLGGEMVRQGHARVYARHSRQYLSQEREAKAAKRGLWAEGPAPDAPRAALR